MVLLDFLRQMARDAFSKVSALFCHDLLDKSDLYLQSENIQHMISTASSLAEEIVRLPRSTFEDQLFYARYVHI